MNINVKNIKQDFPALKTKINNLPLVYLDSAATTLKAKPVIDRLGEFYLLECANVHRGAHYLSDKATQQFEEARLKIKTFINAKSENEIIFTSGTTDSINLVAHSFCEKYLSPGDEIIITQMEHHSNIIPWQVAAQKSGASIKVIEVTESGELSLESYKKLLSSKTKLVAINYISNALGTVNPVKKIIDLAHEEGAKVLVDAAQAVSVLDIDVQKLDCDFLAFSGHKMFGPHGIGVLYGKEDLLNSMPPYKTGGSMISTVTLQNAEYLNSPQRFEAGTPHIAGAVGLAAAVDYINSIGINEIYEHEKSISDWVTNELKRINGLRVIGDNASKINIISFDIKGIHSGDLGHLLDQQGFAIRSGHHCCQPLMDRFSLAGTARVSVSIYNTKSDLENFMVAIEKCKELLL